MNLIISYLPLTLHGLPISELRVLDFGSQTTHTQENKIIVIKKQPGHKVVVGIDLTGAVLGKKKKISSLSLLFWNITI